MNIFIIIYERPSLMGCSDREIRICRADDRDSAIKIAKLHRDRYYKGWSIAVNTAIWDEDNTAYVYCDYR